MSARYHARINSLHAFVFFDVRRSPVFTITAIRARDIPDVMDPPNRYSVKRFDAMLKDLVVDTRRLTV